MGSYWLNPLLQLHYSVKLQWSSVSYDCQALIDSGAEGHFLDSDLAYRLKLPVIVLPQPIAVHALNGLSLPSITHSTGPVRFITSGNHIETIHFLLTDTPVTPVVLGHPWLVLHNPHLNWSQNSILSWSEGCHAACLLSACPSVSCSVFQDEHMDLSNVPSKYRDLKGVFSKSRAASLPPHRPYDCAIDLLPGTSPPKGKLYSLSAPEREAMEKYISDSLAAKIIRPSSSPAGAGARVFLWKRRMGLFVPVSTIEGWITSRWRIHILCRWCLLPLSVCRGRPFSRN